MGRHNLAEEPVPHPLDPPARPAGRSETTGSHRIVGRKAPRRRIAKWPIAVAGLVVLVALGIVGWNWADGQLTNRAEAQAASCSGGRTGIRIVVTPQVAAPVRTAATRWNQDLTEVHGSCVRVDVQSRPAPDVFNALTGATGPAAIGGVPDGWISESPYWVTKLGQAKPDVIGSPAMSVGDGPAGNGYLFVALSSPSTDGTRQRATQSFRAFLKEPAQLADLAAAGVSGP
ncbi:substrate-binding domain-containing protein [Amycolatopsis jiangsuensis]|uniref:Extracellular solute-binding protein n=1 Tax=Amycolatopsis jiangsuensis TaxID=1181879 RepID=A0A840IQ47_9PSEU|nr:substrate-binding domain-containing protein [Amycolatopsis jiangsuensis]MBB4683679.1 hypothetical protein [Amycolatopsis jiangsuensis]